MSATSEPAPPPARTESRQRRGRRRVGVFVVLALAVLAADILTKVAVVARLSNHAPVRLAGGVLYLDLTRNSGAAFSLGTGFTVILSVVALAIVIFLIRAARRLYSLGWATALGLILGGALGNLADRLFRAPGVLRGHVVDFLSLFGPNGSHWPIFNVADSAIVCGAVLAAVLAVRGIDIEAGRARVGPVIPAAPPATEPTQSGGPAGD